MLCRCLLRYNKKGRFKTYRSGFTKVFRWLTMNSLTVFRFSIRLALSCLRRRVMRIYGLYVGHGRWRLSRRAGRGHVILSVLWAAKGFYQLVLKFSKPFWRGIQWGHLWLHDFYLNLLRVLQKGKVWARIYEAISIPRFIWGQWSGVSAITNGPFDDNKDEGWGNCGEESYKQPLSEALIRAYRLSQKVAHSKYVIKKSRTFMCT